MKSLLAEYLRNILEQGDVLDTVLTYKDKQGKQRNVTARSVQKQGQQHPAWPQLQQLLGTSAQAKVEKPSKTAQPQQKPDTTTPAPTPDVELTAAAMQTKEVDSSVDPIENFNENPEFVNDGVSDEEYNRNPKIKPTSKQINVDELGELFADSDGNYKFPKKYIKVLGRILNSQKGKQDISAYTDATGAGQPASQAGELFTMMITSVQDTAQANEILKLIEEHIKSLSPKERPILTSSWVKSGYEVRHGVHARYDKLFGKGNWQIDGSAWDVTSEAEAIGFVDYRNNKGYSTDMTTRMSVTNPTTGEKTAVLNEISLKKDFSVNFLNASSNRLQDIVVRGFATPEELKVYDGLNSQMQALGPKSTLKKAERLEYEELERKRDALLEKYKIHISPEADVDFVKEKQAYLHIRFMGSKKGLSEVNNFLALWKDSNPDEKRAISLQIAADLNQQNKEKYADEISKKIEALSGAAPFKEPANYESAMSNLTGTLKYQQKTNLSIMAAIQRTSGKDNTEAERYSEAIVRNAHEHSKAVLDFLMSDDRAKRGLVASIREEFPLKSLLAGEETMSLGSTIADSAVLSKIFGTDDTDKVQQSLTLRETPPPPSIIYKAKGTGEVIPIAEVVSRPDGIGYGSGWRLDMKLHKRFAKLLESTSRELYGS